jgi:hypothetical protein
LQQILENSSASSHIYVNPEHPEPWFSGVSYAPGNSKPDSVQALVDRSKKGCF